LGAFSFSDAVAGDGGDGGDGEGDNIIVLQFSVATLALLLLL